jgi:hypothetical protein
MSIFASQTSFRLESSDFRKKPSVVVQWSAELDSFVQHACYKCLAKDCFNLEKNKNEELKLHKTKMTK